MKKFLIVLLVALIAVLSVGCSSENNDTSNGSGSSTPGSSTPSTETVSEEERVVNMFMNYGTYQDDTYYITKREGYSQYKFCYNPSLRLFLCNYSMSQTVSNITLYDYGAVSFAWKKFKNGSFYGEHSLNFTYDITFNFHNVSLLSGQKLGNYKYSVGRNTFVNLTAKNDIDEYANNAFECIRLAVNYAQTVVYSNCGYINLF